MIEGMQRKWREGSCPRRPINVVHEVDFDGLPDGARDLYRRQGETVREELTRIANRGVIYEAKESI